MTEELKTVAIMDTTAHTFMREATAAMTGKPLDEISAVMLGTIAGATAVMLASGVPFANVSASINMMLSDMRG